MIRSLYDFLYGSTPANFKSAFGLQESIDRLRAATSRSTYSALTESAACGPVQETKVRLQRVIPMMGNSFKPFFIGRFQTRPDGVYLSGRFTMLPLVKLFMTFWLGAAILIGISVAAIARNQPAVLPVMLGSFSMVGFGIALLGFGKWLARNDIGWLSNVIDGALETPATGRTLTVSPPMAEESIPPGLRGLAGTLLLSGRTLTVGPPMAGKGVPLVLRVVACYLLLSGILYLVLAYGGRLPGPVDARYREPFRTVIAILGVTALALAIGVYQRRLVAWRLGLVFIAATACWGVVQSFFSNAFPEPLQEKILFCVLMLVVWFIWGRWWYAQRVHFARQDSSWPGST